MEFLDIPIFDNDFYKMFARLTIDLIFLSLIISWLYKRRSNKREFVFTFYMIGIIVFFLCFTLKKFELDLGMALGLFAIFGILRYRTDTIDITHLEVGDVNYARETAKIKITYEVSSQK